MCQARPTLGDLKSAGSPIARDEPKHANCPKKKLIVNALRGPTDAIFPRS